MLRRREKGLQAGNVCWARLTSRLLGTVLLLFASLVAFNRASAQIQFPFHLTDGAGFDWDINANGSVNDGTDDAYDGGFRLSIDGNWLPWTGIPVTTEDGGRELVFGPVALGTVQVTRKVFVPVDAPFIRYLEIIENPMDVDQTVSVRIHTNLGSDDDEEFIATSDGDDQFTTNDRWVVTDDSAGGFYDLASGSGGDPVVVSVVWGRAALTRPTYVDGGLEDDTFDFEFPLSVPAHGRAILMMFGSQQENGPHAAAFAEQLSNLVVPQALQGIAPEEAALIQNFVATSDPKVAILSPTPGLALPPSAATEGARLLVNSINRPPGTHLEWVLDDGFPPANVSGAHMMTMTNADRLTGLTVGGTHTVTVALVRDLDGSIVVAANGPVIATSTFSVSQPASLIVSPSSYHFGTVSLNPSYSSQAYITLSVSDGDALEVLSAVSDNPQFVVTSLPNTIRAGSSKSLRIRFTPTNFGPAEGTLTIVHDGVDSPTTVPLSATVEGYEFPVNLFDGLGYRWSVNGAGRIQNNGVYGPSLMVAGFTFPWVPTARPGATPQEIALGPMVPLEGLNVERRVYVAPDNGFVRYLEVFTNSGPADRTITANLSTGIWSRMQSGSVVTTTSSGDERFTPEDLWIVSDESPSDGMGRYPAFAHVVTGEASRLRLDSAAGDPTSSLIQYGYVVTVPAGGEVALMHFVLQRPTVDEAAASAQELATMLPPSALAGLTPDEINAIENFYVGPDPFVEIRSPVAEEAFGPSAAVDGVPLRVALASLPTGAQWAWQLDAPFAMSGPVDPGTATIVTTGETALLTGLNTGETHTVYVALVNGDGTLLDATTYPTSRASATFSISVPPTLLVAPATDPATPYDFGEQTIHSGLTADFTLSIADGGATALTILNATSDNPAFSIDRVSARISASGNGLLRIRFLPETVGPTSGTITIDHDGVNSPLLLYVAGTGIDTTAFNFWNFFDGLGFRWDINGDGSIGDGSSDAYDGGLGLSINGTVFPYMSLAHVLPTGREFEIGPYQVGNLTVTRRVFVPADAGFARFIETITNTDTVDAPVTITIHTDLGSDGHEGFVVTSDGDSNFTPEDNWLVTDDSANGNGGNDPTVIHVVAGTVSRRRPSRTQFPLQSDRDALEYDYEMMVPPGETVAFMHFGAQRWSGDDAIAIAEALANLTPPALEGLTPEDRARIQNFVANADPAVSIAQPPNNGAVGAGAAVDGVLLELTLINMSPGMQWAWQLDAPFPVSGVPDPATATVVPSGNTTRITGLNPGETRTVYVALVNPDGSLVDAAANPFARDRATFSISIPPNLVIDPAPDPTNPLDFRTVGVGLETTLAVIPSITDGGATALTIRDVVSDDPTFAIKKFPSLVTQEGAEPIVIAFRPAAPGPASATITIDHDGANSPLLLYVTGIGSNTVPFGLTGLRDGLGFRWDIQSDGRILDGSNDAYDGAFKLTVNGLRFPTFPNVHIRRPGEEFEVGPARIGVFDVTRRIFVPQEAGFVRYLEVLQNTAPTDETAVVTIYTDLGSDGNEEFVVTSDGDHAFTPADNWIATDDSFTGDGGTTPVVVHVVANDAGDARPVETAFPVPGDHDVVQYSYRVTVPAGGTAILVHFGIQRTRGAEAIEEAQALERLVEPALEGLTPNDIALIANFGLTRPIVPPIEIGAKENVPLTIDLTGFDPNGDPMTFSLWDGANKVSTLTTPSGGTVALTDADPNDATATALYTPAPGFTGEESFAYLASDPDGDGAPALVTVTVSERPLVSVVDALVTEGDVGETPNLVFTVKLSFATDEPVTVDYATESVDATPSTPDVVGDYENVSGTLTIGPSAVQATILVPVHGDAVDEPDETLTLTLSNVSSSATLQTATATGTIQDDDRMPRVSIDDVAVSEPDGSATFTVTLDAESSKTITVDYRLANGSAQAGMDFEPIEGTLVFAPGTVSQTITVVLLDDPNPEPDETFFVNLTNATNAEVIDPQGMATIQDDDPFPTIAIASPTDGEAFPLGTTSIALTVVLENAPYRWRWKLGGPFAADAPDDGIFVEGTDTTTIGGLVDGQAYRIHVALADAEGHLIWPIVADSVTIGIGREVNPNAREFADFLPAGLTLWAPTLDVLFLHQPDRSINVVADGGLHARHLIRLGATVVMRLGDAGFEAVLGRDGHLVVGTDFPLEVGTAYIVNAPDPIAFTVEGLVAGEPIGPPMFSAPPEEPSFGLVWAFAVAGRIDAGIRLPVGTELRIANLRTGHVFQTEVGADGTFLIPFADLARREVVAENDLFRLELRTPGGYPIGAETEWRIGRADLRNAYVVRSLDVRPSRSRLLPNYPNPFNPDTWIPFELREASDVTLQIYDLGGSLVRTLDLGRREAGYYIAPHDAAHWDGRNASGEPVSSGVYLVEFRAGSTRQLRRVLIAK